MVTTRLLGALVSLATLPLIQSQGVITDDSYFYGESPLVPPPIASGTGNWAAAYAKARAFVAGLTIDEKANITTGASNPANGCAGNILPIPRVNFPGLCLQDAGNGVRATDFVSGYPSGLHVGASWNKDLASQRGIHMGGEFRAKGVNVALGPVVAPLGRVAEGGRNWEGFTNDPYLCGALAGVTVAGIQSNGVITSTKHFIAYEQETNRNPATNTTTKTTVQSVSSNVDDQTLHELYLWPFAEALHAGTGSIMCSYNRVNNSYACQNSKTQNGILKDELGYQGFVVSDWGAQHAGVASANSGLDMVMPSSTFWGPNLTVSVQNGSVPESRLDDMVTRIIATWYQMGQDSGFPTPGVGMAANLQAQHPIVNARSPASADTLLQGAIEGHVLVKNVNNALPLKKPAMLSVFGYDAKVPDQYDVGGSGWTGGGEPDVGYTTQQFAGNGTMVSGGGSGAVTPPYISSPFDALLQQAIADGTVLYWDFDTVNSTSSVDPTTSACLVFINAWATEGSDRPGLHDNFSDNLVNNIAAKCNNTIVVIHNAGIRLVDQWINNPNVTAVMIAHLPGQDSGRALVQLLYGQVSPSGKLPYTLAKNESDYDGILAPAQPTGQFVNFPQSNFTEGLLIDYRWFDAKNITPRYEFGFGLSYTTFGYSGLSAQVVVQNPPKNPSGTILQGGAADLWDTVARVTAVVQNTGSVAGAEVAQLYIGNPAQGQPPKQLRGFEKVYLAPGQSQTVSFDLLRRDLSIWDTNAQQWALQNGNYQVWVGSSSRQLPLSGTLSFYQ